MNKFIWLMTTCALMLLFSVPQSVLALSTITVTTTADTLADDGQCSLREAVIAANTDTATGGCAAGNGADTIVFSASLPTPAVFSLTLTGANEDAAASGDLDLLGTLSIQATPGQVIVDGNGTDRVFDVRSGANVTLVDLTIRNGNPGSGGSGGGVRVTGTMPATKLTLLNSLVQNNHAVSGGGIQTEGSGATLILQYSRLTGNGAEVAGGGIANNGIVTVQNSTLDHNQARTGGGIDHEGVSLKITNVTVSNNQATDNGGGLYNRASATLLHVTFAGNRTLDAGGGATLFNDTASLTIKNSIVFNGPGLDPCATNGGTIISQGHNLESADTCGFTASGDLVQTNPLLGPLQNNGGSTPTQALSVGSPAVDGGDNSGCPATDQRGFPRPVDGDGNGSAVCDIGAFEYGASLPPTGTPTASLTALPVTDTLTPTLTSLPPAETDTPTFTETPVETGTATQTETPFPPETLSPTSTSLPPTPPPPIPPCSSASIPLLLLGLWYLRLKGMA